MRGLSCVQALKKQLGIEAINFEVPKVLMTTWHGCKSWHKWHTGVVSTIVVLLKACHRRIDRAVWGAFKTSSHDRLAQFRSVYSLFFFERIDEEKGG